MDRRLQSARRDAALGDEDAAAKALAARLRAGQLDTQALLLPAALGYEPARLLLPPDALARVDALKRRGRAGVKPGKQMVSKLGQFGYEPVLRGGVVAARVVSDQFEEEASQHDLDLPPERLEACVDATEEAITRGLSELGEHAAFVDTLANRTYPAPSLAGLTRELEAAKCWATLTVLALVRTADAGGYCSLGGLEALAPLSLEAYACRALQAAHGASKAKTERVLLALVRDELVPWSVGEVDPILRRRPQPQEHESGCATCGAEFEPEGWGGDRDLYCSTDCYLQAGESMGGRQQRPHSVQTERSLKAKRAADRAAHTRAYFRGDFD